MHACGEIDAEAKDAAAVKVSSSKKNRKNRIRRQKQRQAAAKAAQLAKEAAIEAELEANVAPYRALLLDFMPESHANAILRPLITNKHLTDDFKSTQRPWSDESKDRWTSVQTALQQFLSEEQVSRLKLIFTPLTLVIEVVRYILEQGNCTEEVMYSRLEIVELWWRYWAGWLNFSDDEPDVGEGHSEADSSDTCAEFHPADLDFYGYQCDSDHLVALLSRL